MIVRTNTNGSKTVQQASIMGTHHIAGCGHVHMHKSASPVNRDRQALNRSYTDNENETLIISSVPVPNSRFLSDFTGDSQTPLLENLRETCCRSRFKFKPHGLRQGLFPTQHRSQHVSYLVEQLDGLTNEARASVKGTGALHASCLKAPRETLITSCIGYKKAQNSS